MDNPVVVDFPLRGEWVAPNTPGRRVPSHGTDQLGQRYAYDFVRTDPAAKGLRFYRGSAVRYLTRGVPLRDCYGWGAPIFSPVAGTVVEAADGWPERDPVHPVRDLGIALKNGFTFNPRRAVSLRPLVGNYLIIEADEGFALLAHAQMGSLQVAVGDEVAPGRQLARVGHSGNTTVPHLHFQMMDRRDGRTAKGVLCCFREYELLVDGDWRLVRNGIPEGSDRIRRL